MELFIVSTVIKWGVLWQQKKSQTAFAVEFVSSHSALVKPCEVHKGVSGVQITEILYNETL